jgi:hypothetical protein
MAASAAVSNTPSILRFGAEFLGFAIAVAAAGSIAERVASAATGVYRVAIGDYDDAIATWINEGGMARTQAAIAATAAGVVDYTKGQIIDAINGFIQVTNGMNDPNNPPNRFAAADVNEVILHWLEIYIQQFRDQSDIDIILSNLMSALAMIVYDEGEAAKDASIQAAATALDVNLANREDPKTQAFIALITVNALAVDKKDNIIRSKSMPLPTEPYHTEPKKASETSASLPDNFEFRPYAPGDMHVAHETKSRFTRDNMTDQDVEEIAVNKIFNSANMNDNLKKLYRDDNEFRDAMKSGAKPYMSMFAVLSDKNQERIVGAISKTATIIVRKKQDLKLNQQQIISSIETALDEIEKGDSRSRSAAIKGDPEDQKRGRSRSRDRIPPIPDKDEMVVVEEGGSRRRHRKSRRYKKKKTTLKRRQMKRRRTRKGKKRRHTKKR